jgi:CDP-glucose 4,6-dehydratase
MSYGKITKRLGKCGMIKMKNVWQNKNVLVTGATGIIGSWLVKKLVDNGANVLSIIRDQVPKSGLVLSGYINKINIINGKLEDYSTVERALNEYEIEACFHLGAQTIVQTANRSPISTFESNIKGTWNVLEAARKSQLLKSLIIASSDKAYGEHKNLPYKEDYPLKGLHPYDVSKTCADMLSQTYANTYGMPIGITRCGNVYGGCDLNFNRIVPGTIRSILFNEEPIIRSDGTLIREYIYVLDIVEAYMHLAENINKIKGQAFNFGTEKAMSVLEITNKIIEVMDSNLKPKVLSTAKGEINKQTLSCEKARELLNWKAAYSIEQGLKETVAWYKSFFNK